MTGPWLRFTFLLVLLSLAPCKGVDGRPVPADAWPKIADTVKRIREEEARFLSTHDFKGKTALFARDGMEREGFKCVLEYREYFFIPPNDVLPRTAVTPVLYCVRRGVELDSICIERRATFRVAWSDPSAPLDRLNLQLESALVSHQVHACKPKDSLSR